MAQWLESFTLNHLSLLAGTLDCFIGTLMVLPRCLLVPEIIIIHRGSPEIFLSQKS